jgi:hypothetical protein
MNTPRLELSATAVLAVAGLAVGGLLAWRLYHQAGDLVQAGADLVRKDLNPASSDNVVNRALEQLGQAVTGEEGWTLGGQVFDWTHTDETDPGRNTAIAAINPADQDNLINRGVSAIGRSVSGDPAWSLGGWIYDVTHPSKP